MNKIDEHILINLNMGFQYSKYSNELTFNKTCIELEQKPFKVLLI